MMRGAAVFANASGPLDADRAWSVLRPYWEEIVGTFRHKGHPEPGNVTRVKVDPKWHDTCRHFAGASQDARILVVAPELADMPVASIVAILAHECGHFVDLANPGRYWFRRASNVRVRKGARAVSVKDLPPTFRDDALFFFEHLPDKNLGKHLNEWRARESDEVERAADAIAEVVTGHRIGYTGAPGCLVQTMGSGVERPIGLR
jgi:hypothetical protein